MARVIRTLSNSKNIAFEDIVSFRTKSFVGIWDYEEEKYLLIGKACSELYTTYLPECDDLEQLDYRVYSECGEYILEVFDHGAYKIELDVNEED